VRNFQILDKTLTNGNSDAIEFSLGEHDDDQPHLAMRPRYEDLARALGRLSVVEGLATTRQVGTGQAYLALGLMADRSLMMRLTIVADATGHLSLNMKLTAGAATKLYDWLGVATFSDR
jgi:hypothetical protein